jgi:hypothetical protein
MMGIGTLLLALLLSLAVPQGAGAFRCGNDLVQEGDRKIEVLHKCGEPDSVDEWETVKPVSTFVLGHRYPNVANVKVEEWTYNFGPNVFIQIYRFENGEVVEMRYGGYGF